MKAIITADEEYPVYSFSVPMTDEEIAKAWNIPIENVPEFKAMTIRGCQVEVTKEQLDRWSRIESDYHAIQREIGNLVNVKANP